MARLRERIPLEFSDDARWGRYFTNTHMVIMIVLVIISLLFVMFMGIFGLTKAGLIISLAFDIVVMLSIMIPINDFSSLHLPAGISIAVILFRAARVKKDRKIYISCYESEEEEGTKTA